MTRIVVDLGWVAGLRSDVSDTAEALKTSPRQAVDLSSSPGVDGAFTRFMRKWDRRAGELGGCLDSVANFLEAVNKGFSTADEALASATDTEP